MWVISRPWHFTLLQHEKCSYWSMWYWLSDLECFETKLCASKMWHFTPLSPAGLKISFLIWFISWHIQFVSWYGFDNVASQTCTWDYFSYILFDWFNKWCIIAFDQSACSFHGFRVTVAVGLHFNSHRYIEPNKGMSIMTEISALTTLSSNSLILCSVCTYERGREVYMTFT